MTSASVKLFTPTAKMPERGSKKAAGLDVRADFFDEHGNARELLIGRERMPVDHFDPELGLEGWRYVLKPGCRVLIPTGIGISTSEDIYSHIVPRSGYAIKDGIQILGGIVDADYTGEVGCILYNSDPKYDFEIRHGMKVAQIVFTGVSLIIPDLVADLDIQERGAGGFGSTGIR
jgi:dUTP pyrophosphatase